MYDINLIKLLFIRKGLHLSDIAKKHGFSRSAITHALKHGKRRSRVFLAVEKEFRELYGEDLPKIEDSTSNFLAA